MRMSGAAALITLISMSSSSFHFSPRPNRANEIKWREWSPEAFREAKEQDKPILLGISAVWCHWCHVMDETSYSDDEVIRLANERYVPIRVDNDQRPDVNRRYNMGGWPTTAFLTPEGEILHGGTYIPPEQMRGYLEQVADVWSEKRDEIGTRIRDAEKKAGGHDHDHAGTLSWEIVEDVGRLIRGQYDPQYGGFGREPKFPQPKLLRSLIDRYRRGRSPDVAAMLHKTLGAMAGGGMYDHVEGGFFRYSTTRQWQIPHFEKMLEDNAELLAIYADAHQLFPDAGYDRVVRDVIRWMDATLWRDDVQLFGGSQDADEHYYALDAAERTKHDSPFVDRRLYTGWNSLAGSAYLAAGEALGDPVLTERGRVVGRSIDRRMRGPAGELFHFDSGDGPQLPDLLADLGAYVNELLDAYEAAVGHPEHYSIPLDKAIELATRMRALLEDADHGGFWDAPEREELGRVTQREKSIEDGASAADALLRLAALTGDEQWRRSALRALEGFVGEYRQWGQFAAGYATAVARALTEPLVITVVGPAADARAEALWKVARASDDPAVSLQRVDPSDAATVARLGYPADRVAAYVCVGTACSEPIGEPVALERELVRSRLRLERDRLSA
jgi:uncharacterized protein YyaL (SSP411 family)